MKIILSILLFAISFIAFSQTPTIVSTVASNKNVLIEEFTGINCQFCPCGHKVVNTLIADNPGLVWGINIHAGSYAETTPDYTTTFGDSYLAQANVTGFPAGTVNRHIFSGSTTEVSYGDFGTNAVTINEDIAPCNVAVSIQSFDFDTREVKLLVEVYYTSASSVSTNYLNLAILQNKILGSQVVASQCSYPENMVGSQYTHNHMLRHMITGTWGNAISSTATGSFWDSVYTYTIPESYGSIPVVLNNLEFVAFVTEGHQEILNCHGVKAPGYERDASITAVTIPTFTCENTCTPTVTLSNPSRNTMTAATISYYFNAANPLSYSWTGSLSAGESTEVTLPTISIPATGKNTLTAKTTNFNNDTDLYTDNDASSASIIYFPAASTDNITQNFTASTFPPTNMAVSAGGTTTWVRSAKGHEAAGSAFIQFYNINSGQKDQLIFYPLSFAGKTNMNLSFWVAYRQYSSENDKLQVDISTNCGSTWTTKWTKSGSSLATGAATTSNFANPSASEWTQYVVSLGNDNAEHVLIRFQSTSGYGNNLYLDDILISPTASITNYDLTSGIDIYPNPANENTNISIISENNLNANIVISNALGQIVYTTENELVEGENIININTSSFENGIYFVKINTENGVKFSKFNISK